MEFAIMNFLNGKDADNARKLLQNEEFNSIDLLNKLGDLVEDLEIRMEYEEMNEISNTSNSSNYDSEIDKIQESYTYYNMRLDDIREWIAYLGLNILNK